LIRNRLSSRLAASSTEEYTLLTNISCGVFGVSAPNVSGHVPETLFSKKVMVVLLDVHGLPACRSAGQLGFRPKLFYKSGLRPLEKGHRQRSR
jgi:hypothetical protein